MLRRLRRGDWLAVAAALLFAGFCILALTNSFSAPEPQTQKTERGTTKAAQESAQDIATETVAYYTKVLAWFTGVLAAVSVFQGIFLFRADKTARTSADAARDAANHARRSVETMEDTAKKQLRAHIHVVSAQVSYDRRDPDRCFVAVTVKNYGQTPAMNVISLYGEHVREWPLRTILPAPSPIRHAVAPLPPNRELIQRVPISLLSAWEENELREGRAGVYFWSVTTYTDIYGEPHQTNVRLVCEGEGLRRGHMHACEEGNSAT